MADNQNESDGEATRAYDARPPLLTFGRVIVASVVVMLLIALLLPATRSVREPARRNLCINNPKQIALAIQSYESDKGEFPPAYTMDAQGRRLHSWRTLILPYMEESKLFETIDLTKAWDDPANAKAGEASLDVYTCPSADHKQGLTTYLAVAGPQSIFSGPVPRKRDEATDESETTMCVVDVAADQAVHWMSPNDVSDDELLRINADSTTNHFSVFNAAFLDGQVRSVPKSVDAKALRAMLTIDGGEAMGDDVDATLEE